MIYDVAIVGGGLGGLTCAEKLLRSRLRVVLIEGRARLGGRVFSRAMPGLSVHAELGAEFIHGTPAELMERVNDETIPFMDACDEHLFLRNGRLRKIDFWSEIETISKKLKGKRDESVAAYLKRSQLAQVHKAL